MKINEYKKTYKEFIIFLTLHFLTLVGVGVLSVIKDFVPLVLIANIITVGMTLLMYIIYVTENIYWMNGIEYERALFVGSERRKAFALKHLKRMGAASLFGIIVTALSFLLSWSQLVTFPIIFIVFIIACISTVNFEL